MNNIRLEHIDKRFGERVVLEDFSAILPLDEPCGVMGASGCGKTTLAGVLLGTVTPDSGTVVGVPEPKAAVFQEDRLCEDLNAVANVRMVTGKRVPRPTIVELLEQLGLGGSLSKPVRTLSGGMRRRVAIARALMADSEFVVLDEPFTGLDDEARHVAAEIIRRHTKGKALFLISHDPQDFVLLHAKRATMTPAGLIWENG